MCGKNIKESTLPISMGSQVTTYLVSLLFPPLGLWPGVKYLTSKRPNGKMVGTIALLITLVATILLFVITIQIANRISAEINSSFQKYQNVGL